MTLFQENSSPFLSTLLVSLYTRLLLFGGVGPTDLETFIACSTHELVTERVAPCVHDIHAFWKYEGKL